MKRNLKQDAYILECCLSNNGQAYVGVDRSCNKSSVFCIQHGCHFNDDGLMHQMIPLRQFKSKIDQKKLCMQNKISQLIQTFSRFIDSLVENIHQLKLRKCAQLSMLWLRDLAKSEDQFQLLSKVYRMDLQELSCKDIHSVYYRIIHNDQLFKKSVSQIPCYKGISQALQLINQSRKSTKLLAEKLTQIQGVITNGQILKKALPDSRQQNQGLKQVLLEQSSQTSNFQILYNKSKLKKSSASFNYFFSKYCLVPHINYQISIKTKYGNIMLGICTAKVKESKLVPDIHYHEQSIVYNFANGNTYRDGMFVSGSNASVSGLNQLNVKLRLTDTQILIVTKKNVLMRCARSRLGQNIYLLGLARTQGDQFQIQCDNDISANNIQMEQIIKQIPVAHSQQKQKQHVRIQNESKSREIQKNMSHKQDRQSIGISNKNDMKNNDSSVGVIEQEQEHLQNTLGFQRNLTASFKGLTNLQAERGVKSNVNQKISKIRAELNSLKNNYYIDFAKQKASNIYVQNKSQIEQWQQKKDKYLKNIKQRVSSMRPAPIQNKNHEQEQKKQRSRKSSKIHGNLRMGTESSAFEKVNTGSEVQNSCVKINISDGNSDIISLPKGSILLSALRKGSDTISKIEQKKKGVLQMAESMQPRLSGNKQMGEKLTIDKITTPPKMYNFEQRFQVNDSFQF